MASYTVRVESASPEFRSVFRDVCESFVVSPRSASDEIRVSLDEVGSSRVFSARVGGELLRSETSARSLAAYLEWWLCERAVARSAGHVHVHAAAIAKAGVAVLLPGLSGAGKSTLAVAALSRGFEILSDDVSLVHRTSRRVVPFMRSFHLDKRSVTLLQAAGVTARGVTADQETFSPSTFGSRVPSTPKRVRLVLFPDRECLGAGAVVRLNHAEAALALAAHVTGLGGDAPRTLGVIARLLSGCTCVRLGTSDLHVSLDVLQSLVDEQAWA